MKCHKCGKETEIEADVGDAVLRPMCADCIEAHVKKALRDNRGRMEAYARALGLIK